MSFFGALSHFKGVLDARLEGIFVRGGGREGEGEVVPLV